MFGFYQDMEIHDRFPINLMQKPLIKLFQDCIAPFYIFIKNDYRLKYKSMQQDLNLFDFELEGSNTFSVFKKVLQRADFKIKVTNKGIDSIEIHNIHSQKTIVLKAI